MSTKPPIRLIDTEANAETDRRALSGLDKGVLACVAIALLAAPLWAATFASPPTASFAGMGLMEAFGMPLVLMMTALATCLTVLRESKHPVLIGAVPGLAGATILLGLWSALSLVRAPALYLGLNSLSALLTALFLGGLISRLGRDRKAFGLMLGVLLGTGSLIAVRAILEYLMKWQEGAPQHRAFGTFINPDFLAGYLLLLLPIAIAAFAATDLRKARFGCGLAIGLLSAGLLLTGSRAGVGAVFAAVGLWLVLAVWSGATRERWQPILVALVIFLAGAALASAPTRARISANPNATPVKGSGALGALEATAATQSHSGEFRRYTWMGTVAMAKANLLLGTGIGTFEVAYPRYATTAFTAHAHNSYLQWVGETGVPGALFLLTAFAAVAAFAIYVLRLGRAAPEEASTPTALQPDVPFAAPRLLLAGMLAGVAASAFHSAIDSDWYVVAIMVTLSAVLALTVALARDIAPLATQTPRRVPAWMLGIGIVAALFLVWRAEATGLARLDVAAGMVAEMEMHPEPAIDSFRAAGSADPFDPEAPLQLATLYQMMQRPDETEKALQAAARIAPTGRTYYRLAQYYGKAGNIEQAIANFEKARALEPRNVQNLRALGDVLHRAGQNDRAVMVYQTIVDLENGKYGKVRAMPEMVETEFGFAHIGLADIAYEGLKWSEAATEYSRAADILREFFQHRDWLAYAAVPVEKRKALIERYGYVLDREIDALTRAATPQAAAEKARAEQERAEYRKGKAEDEAKAPTLQNGPGAGNP